MDHDLEDLRNQAEIEEYMEREGLVSPEDAMQDDLEAEMAEQAVAEQQALDSERESAMTEFLLLQRFAEAHGLSPEQTEALVQAYRIAKSSREVVAGGRRHSDTHELTLERGKDTLLEAVMDADVHRVRHLVEYGKVSVTPRSFAAAIALGDASIMALLNEYRDEALPLLPDASASSSGAAPLTGAPARGLASPPSSPKPRAEPATAPDTAVRNVIAATDPSPVHAAVALRDVKHLAYLLEQMEMPVTGEDVEFAVRTGAPMHIVHLLQDHLVSTPTSTSAAAAASASTSRMLSPHAASAGAAPSPQRDLSAAFADLAVTDAYAAGSSVDARDMGEELLSRGEAVQQANSPPPVVPVSLNSLAGGGPDASPLPPAAAGAAHSSSATSGLHIEAYHGGASPSTGMAGSWHAHSAASPVASAEAGGRAGTPRSVGHEFGAIGQRPSASPVSHASSVERGLDAIGGAPASMSGSGVLEPSRAPASPERVAPPLIGMATPSIIKERAAGSTDF